MWNRLESGTRLGHYEIISSIAAGGMGVVYLARDVRLERRVAVKVLPAEHTRDPDRVRRFEQEARAASGLNHPNILTIYDFGESHGTHYLATEFVDGHTLRQMQKKGVDVRSALRIVSQVAGALAAAHAAGIVHRDIKPENIMVRRDGYAKVLDFGLAKLIERQGPRTEMSETMALPEFQVFTEPGAIIGTVAYMSPEQARGVPVDARTDVWSLGVVLHELMAGAVPFHGNTAADTIVSILQKNPPPLHLTEGPARDEITRIISKALEKNPEDRYQSAADLAVDIKKLEHRIELDAERAKHPVPAVTRPAITLPPPPKATSTPVFALALVAAVLAAGTGLWTVYRHSKPSAIAPAIPERLLTYSLTVQRMRRGVPEGEPFESAGQETFHNGWKFRFNFSSPHPGWFYLINETAGTGSSKGYAVLFPLPGTSAHLNPNAAAETGWYLFDAKPGTEKCWGIWASDPIPELDALVGRVMNDRAKGVISEGADIRMIEAILVKDGSAVVQKRQEGARITASGRGRILIVPLEFRHE